MKDVALQNTSVAVTNVEVIVDIPNTEFDMSVESNGKLLDRSQDLLDMKAMILRPCSVNEKRLLEVHKVCIYIA
jgi:hypothetical protein